MTRDEILNMEAGREMDALVAENVMGMWIADVGKVGAILATDVSYYSTDIAAAWQVVEKMQSMGYIYLIWTKTNNVKIYQKINPQQEYFRLHDDIVAPTAPLAISRAALLAVLHD